MIQSWFVQGMIRATTDMWVKGWDERNGGNVSLRLLDEDLRPYLQTLQTGRTLPIGEKVEGLAGQCFLVTGSGKFFRNVQLDPEANLGIVRVCADEETVDALWGFGGDGIPTSEISSHLKSHRARQLVSDGRDRVIMHCHATNLIALTFVLDLNSATITRALWEGSTECLVVFPDGVGVLPWMVPGTSSIGEATSAAMSRHTLTLWPFHGVFGCGATLDEAFGLIDTAEKSAQILVKVISMGGIRHTISTQQLLDLAKRFQVNPMLEAIEVESWWSAPTNSSRS